MYIHKYIYIYIYISYLWCGYYNDVCDRTTYHNFRLVNQYNLEYRERKDYTLKLGHNRK